MLYDEHNFGCVAMMFVAILHVCILASPPFPMFVSVFSTSVV